MHDLCISRNFKNMHTYPPNHPTRFIHYRPSHPGFVLLWTTGRIMSARRIDSEWDFTCEDRITSGEAEGDVQVLAMRRKGKQERICCIVNAYFETEREGHHRPAERAQWDLLLEENNGPIMLAGDFNVHSSVWNPQCQERRRARFLDDLIDTFQLKILNDDSQSRFSGNSYSLST